MNYPKLSSLLDGFYQDQNADESLLNRSIDSEREVHIFSDSLHYPSLIPEIGTLTYFSGSPYISLRSVSPKINEASSFELQYYLKRESQLIEKANSRNKSQRSPSAPQTVIKKAKRLLQTRIGTNDDQNPLLEVFRKDLNSNIIDPITLSRKRTNTIAGNSPPVVKPPITQIAPPDKPQSKISKSSTLENQAPVVINHVDVKKSKHFSFNNSISPENENRKSRSRASITGKESLHRLVNDNVVVPDSSQIKRACRKAGARPPSKEMREKIRNADK